MIKVNDRLLQEIRTAVQSALAEDIGRGDATTLGCVPEGIKATANFLVKQDGVLSGIPVAQAVFRELDNEAEFEVLVEDGTQVKSGTIVARVKGCARALLTGERTALNFMQRMSGVASLTQKFVVSCEGTRAKILDTRKTTPNLRALEKYAVLCGGALNHRKGLYDKIMIKDNHREIAAVSGPGGIIRSVKSCREKFPELEIEVEADTLEEVKEALEAGADIILLDNMSNEQLREAVLMNAGRSLLEASGGVNLDTVEGIAHSGVDYISVGALTHSAGSIDISLEIKPGV